MSWQAIHAETALAYRELLAEHFEGEAVSRLLDADEHPEDGRALRCAQALESAASTSAGSMPTTGR